MQNLSWASDFWGSLRFEDTNNIANFVGLKS